MTTRAAVLAREFGTGKTNIADEVDAAFTALDIDTALWGDRGPEGADPQDYGYSEYGWPNVTMGEAMVASQERYEEQRAAREQERIDAAVFRIANMNAVLTLAQARGDRAAVLIIEGQLAALRA